MPAATTEEAVVASVDGGTGTGTDQGTAAAAASQSPERVRNQAPGIPDRRKSLRPGKSKSSPSTRGDRRKSSGGGGISVRVTSVADMASEMRLKKIDDEGDHDNDNGTDTFEDATSTPRPMSQEVEVEVGREVGREVEVEMDVDVDAGAATQRGSVSEGGEDLVKEEMEEMEEKEEKKKESLPVLSPTSTTTTTERRKTPPGFARKASSGFGALLGRMGSIRKPARSPPASRQERERLGVERRNTAASMALSNGDGGSGQDGLKQSLQDQFSSLRRQEEFGLHEDIPTSGGSATSPPSSMSAGPTAHPAAVNWDLWQQVVYEGPSAVSRTSGDELTAAITAGIPPAIRGVVWQVLAESKNEELENIYRIHKARGTEAEHKPQSSRTASIVGTNGTSIEKDALASDASSEHSNHATSPPTSVDSHVPDLQSKLMAEKQKREAASLLKLEKAIKRDLGSRTSYSKYTQSAGLQDGLFGVCKAYALFDEGVGYAQGINFIAMPLLFNMAEEEAFTLLVRLMSKYDLRSMFTPDMRGLHLKLYQFERLLEEHEPAVYCHLKRRNVEPQLYATQWFLTLFVYRFPLQLTLRIYDLILSEGLAAILKIGIVLIQHNRQALLDIKDMSQLTNFLKEKLFDVYIDKSPSASSLLDSGFFGSVTGGADKELYRADDMVRDACSIKLSDDILKAYSLEWEELQRLEREREAELENLRTSNASLTTRIKSLEERAQQHDSDHVGIAQDLVTLKVENDKLRDDNEGLDIQVQELQKMIDAQPAEVEARLKAEMDRIMTRNIEVQNENRGLKEEMDEMEHELVNAKMAHAQAQADHDALKQKWNSVQAMLNEKQ